MRAKRNQKIHVDDISDFIYDRPITHTYEITCRIISAFGIKRRVTFPQDVRISDADTIVKWMCSEINYSSFYLNEISNGVIVGQYRIDVQDNG